MRFAAIVAVVLLEVIAVFQIALALGAPLGFAAWGGRHESVLPTRLRIASGVAAVVVYPLIILFVLASAGLREVAWLPGTGMAGMWILTGLFTWVRWPLCQLEPHDTTATLGLIPSH